MNVLKQAPGSNDAYSPGNIILRMINATYVSAHLVYSIWKSQERLLTSGVDLVSAGLGCGSASALRYSTGAYAVFSPALEEVSAGVEAESREMDRGE